MNRLRRSRVAIPLPCIVAGALVVGAGLPAASPAAAAAQMPAGAVAFVSASAGNTVPTPIRGRFNRRVCPGPPIGTAGCHARIITDSEGTPLATSVPAGYGPAQFHGAYELPKTAPIEQTVAIVDAYDAPTIEEDLAVYSETYGLPACTEGNGCFRKVNQSGQKGPYPKVDTGWAVEIALDVETVHAICQNCKILLVEASSANFTDLTAAVNMAATLGATQISNSYGGPEFSGETSATYASPYNHPGIAVTVSAGDSGYKAEYPASSPYVVAVGGTTLNLGAGNTYESESVWSGSGSGCSAYVSAQSWQTSDSHWAATGCGVKRGVADIAADANPNTGAAVYDSTKDKGQVGWFQVGGTSLSAPLIAAVYALAGGGVANYPAADPYSHQTDSPASLHDVTTGSNGSCGGTTMCTGATGYDGPTGVGTPKGIAAFAGGGADTTPPQTTITSAPSSPTNDSTPSFSFSSNEAGSTFECRLDGASFATCTSPYTAAPLTDGSHTFEVRAKDTAGNTDASPASAGFTVDTQPPSVGLTSPADGSLTGSATPALSGTAGTASGDSSTVTVKVYAGTNTSGTLQQTRTATRDPSTGAYSVAATALGSGTYTAQASQADSAGNTGVSVAHTFTVDTVAPSSSASSPGLTNSPSISVSYTASDTGGSGVASVELWAKPPGAGSYSKVATDSSPGASGSFPYTAGAGDGTYSFYTRATDKAGNYEAAPGSADSNSLVDTTPPQTTITPTPPSVTNDATPTFSFSSSESGSSFECSVDGAGFSGCTSPYTSAALGDGAHKFEVRAVDAATNTDPTPASASFTVDTAIPVSQAESIATTNSTTITIGYTASDTGSGLATVELWVKVPGAGTYSKVSTDSSPSASGSFLYGAFSGDGTYSFYTRATDKAGNYEAAPGVADSTTVLDTTVPDTEPPETTITSAPPNPTNDSTPAFGFSSSELGSTFECSLDGGTFATCTSPYTAAPLTDGSHTFEVRAKDAAGNEDLTPASTTFTVDTHPPTVGLTNPTDAGITADSTPTLSGTGGTAVGDSPKVNVKIYSGTGTGGTLLQTREAARDPSTGAYSIAATTLSSGTYTAQASQTDSAGNTGLSAAHTFTVDATAPTSQASAASITNSTSIAVSYTASDSGGAGLASVELWVKVPGAVSYAKAATDSSPGASGSFPYTASDGDGTYSFYTLAVDGVGNEQAGPESAAVVTVLDTTPPQTAIDSGPTGATNDSTPTFSFSSSELGSTFECSLDGGGFVKCASPHTTAPLADGAHTFEVRATDIAGNKDPAPAIAAFTVNTEPEPGPPAPLAEPPSEQTAPPTGQPPAGTSSAGTDATPVVRLVKTETSAAAGSAALMIHVSGPGTLVVFGPRVRKVKKSVSEAGTLKLAIRPKDRFKHRLNRTRVTVIYTPTDGSPTTLTTTIRFG